MKGFAPILDTALDAVVITSSGGVIVGWNRAAEQTFGWTSQEALGAEMGALIVPPKHREAHWGGMRRYLRTGEARVLGQRIEIAGLTKAGREIPIELSITSTVFDGEDLFIGFLRDISGRREAEEALQRRAREAELLFELTRLASETESVDEALHACLKAICSVTGWPVGHAFVLSNGAERELVPTALWYEATPGASERLQAATGTMKFKDGEGLPGRVLATGEPVWIADANNDPNFYRKSAGLGAAFGFPITSEGRIIAVLEFFTTCVSQPDTQLMLTVRTLGEQLGRVMERKRTEEHQRLLVNELNHRVKNTLAIVQGVAAQTFRGDAAEPAARHAFESRLTALAEAHDLLTGANWEAAGLKDIVEKSVRGCGADPMRITIEGPDIRLQPRAAVSLAMALHELCTNATKYGALSTGPGSVSVSWEVKREGDGPRLSLFWQERGGPVVSPPSNQGFGSRMIKRVLASELGGTVELEFPPTGVLCKIEAPLPSVTEA